MKDNWTVAPRISANEVATLGFPPAQSQLLHNRGITSHADAQRFLNPSTFDFHPPLLLPDMEAAVTRLRAAIAEDELIGIFGDFDMDGISGTAVVDRGLRGLGGRTLPYLPHRDDEGHGLNPDAVRSLANRGVSVLITVDCGADSTAESELAASLGIDCIITDHHTMFESGPYPVLAMINPMRPDSDYPFPHMTGVGMAYKLMQALYAALGRDDPSYLQELVALGTVGDVGPMTSENRRFVSEGLRRMGQSSFPGLRALIDISAKSDQEIDTSTLSFQIIPRINAAGRIGDPAESLELLTTADEDRARQIALKLNEYNDRRKELTSQGIEQAEKQIHKRWGNSLPGIIMVGSTDWIPGILGLIAARLTDEHGRPAIAVSIGETVNRASARSVEGYDILKAIESGSDLLMRFGGHQQAAGFTAPKENMRALADRLESVSAGVFDESKQGTNLDIDITASPSVIRHEVYDFARALRPYGKGCPQPMFHSTGLSVLNARSVGNGRHLKLTLGDDTDRWDAIAFRHGERLDEVTTNRAGVEIAYTMEPNIWNGRTTIQLVVKDFALM